MDEARPMWSGGGDEGGEGGACGFYAGVMVGVRRMRVRVFLRAADSRRKNSF